VELGACDFREEHAQALATEIGKLGLHCSVGKNPDHKRLCISARTAAALFQEAAKLAPPSLQYKLPAEFQGRYNRNAYLPEPGVRFHSKPIVIPAEPQMDNGRKRSRPVYCIDVSEMRNFIADGVVVHNCKARKIFLSNGAVIPLPVVKGMAAKACRARLVHELLAVDPVVIVPLGNWALWALADIPKARIYGYRGSRLEIDLKVLADRIARGLTQAPMRQVQDA
jgi:hypothetical protein